MGKNCTLCGGNGHNHRTCSEKGKKIKLFGVDISSASMSTKKDYKRKIKKGSHWTEDEQREFLKGLEFHGKGNWAKIGKDFLPNRTATQIASHAQKYFVRLDANSNHRKNPKKPSVFDVHLEKTEDSTAAIVQLGNYNQESAQETHKFLPKALPLTWVYMYPYHHYASTSASATTFERPLSGISSSSSSENLELSL